jgi:cytochrome c-type biogenesis protein
MDLTLIIPAFFAGLLTFLAPCTLPLVPGYLSFISGASLADLQDPTKQKRAKVKIFFNGLFFILGFSIVFIILGTLAGLAGAAFAPYRLWFSAVGGVLVIFFGLFMMGVIKFSFLAQEKQFKMPSIFGRGKPLNSLVLGSAFGFGWTPCVGPLLGSILLLASSSATALQGAFMLSVFSLGLAMPFLAIAAGVGSASRVIARYFEVVMKYRVPILVFFGALIGVLAHPLVVTPGALRFAPLNIIIQTSIFPEATPAYITVIAVALLLGIFGYVKRVDTVAVIGGIFFVYLGILLLTNNMGILISYTFELLRFINYEEALLDYL